MVSDALDEAAGGPVDLYINSPGGSVPAGSEIYTLIKEYSGEKVSKITGWACSAASFVMLATDKVLIAPTGQVMIHNASSGTQGNRHAHTSGAQMLLSNDEAMASLYAAKTGKSKEEIMSLMDQEIWFNAQKAVEIGLADEIMFGTDVSTNISASSASSIELPQAVIDKVRNELIKKDPTALSPDEPENKSLPKGKGDEDSMNLEELKAKYPDLYAAVVAEGVTVERSRIVELNAMADAPGAADIVAKAITEGHTAAQAAMDIVKASKSRLTTEGTARAADAVASNAAAVKPEDPTPVKLTDEQEAQAHADGIVAEMQKLMGGKK